MSQPAVWRRGSNPFIRAKKQTGSKKLGLDLEKLHPSDNLRQDHLENSRLQQFLTGELQQAEREGKYSKSKKIRRALNQALEEALWYHASWCQTCNNVLHNCICKGD